jgi:small conductance mechanosensitive channel
MINKLLWVGLVISLIVFIHFIANFIFNKIVKNKISKRKETISLVVVNFFKYVGLMIGIFIILAIFGVDTASVLAGAGLLGILLGLGLQKLMQDMINGFFIIFENQYIVGEFVEINNIVGEVIELGLKTTKILTYNGEEHYFANGEIKSIANFSRNNSLVIIDLPILHEYNIKTINIILERVISNFDHSSIIRKPKILGVQSINEITYLIRITCETKSFEHFGVARKLKDMIVDEFEKSDVKFLEYIIVKK